MAQTITPGERILDLQKASGMTQAELAHKIGLSPSQLGRIENGNTTSVSSDILVALAKEFNVSTDYILGLTEISAPKNSDISELGLSEIAVRKLLDGSINTDILNRLMEHKDFPFLLKLIQIYFCDSAALGMSSRNESIDFMIDVLTDFGQENPEYKEEIMHDQDTMKAQKMKPHEAESEKIKEVLFRMMKEIKQDIDNKIPTSPITMASSMKDMLAALPRQARRKASKGDIANLVAMQAKKQFAKTDRESLLLTRDVLERILELTEKK
ncbi:MAG: helix-turn-helix transcriptional regulator [Anaerolineaceae bacterium]|nr:helix-turn-helix transcriptional regulator [Anaerolineaceae bacterium]